MIPLGPTFPAQAPANASRAPALDFTAWAHPVLAVPCPACLEPPGRPCARPSGHEAMDLHPARRAAADRAFVAQHGPAATVTMADGAWVIDPQGRAGLRLRPAHDLDPLAPGSILP